MHRFAQWTIALLLGALGALLTTAHHALGQNDTIADTLALIDSVRTGGWIVISLAVVNLATSLLKQTPLLSWVPKRWRIAIPVVLGGIAGILSNVIGGVPPLEALWVGLFSGPGAVFAHEAVTEAVLGRSSSRQGPLAR